MFNKEELKTIRKIFTGKLKLDDKQKEEFKNLFSPHEWWKSVKDNKFMYLIIILAFFCGVYIASQYYETLCYSKLNEVIFNASRLYGNYNGSYIAGLG